MSLQDNKALTVEFMNALDEGRIEDVRRLLHDDLEWWIIGSTKASGTKTKEKFLREFAFELTLIDGKFNFRIGDIIAEGDLVSVEVWGNAKLQSGGAYANTYIYKLKFRDGQIIGIREFMDTALVDSIFGPRPPKKEKAS